MGIAWEASSIFLLWSATERAVTESFGYADTYGLQKHSLERLSVNFEEEGRGTRSGYEASKGSKGILGL